MAHPTGTQPPEPAAHSRPHRNDRGLTTLEWLLIVAAVAGLAALAVVLVQNVVDETAEQISGSNARLTAAEVAAAEITADTKKAVDNTSDGTDTQEDNQAGSEKCNRLAITYGDAFTESGKKSVWQTTDKDTQVADAISSSAAQGCYIN